jgi:nucleoside-diphosphate-sugar epimerase
LTAGPATKKLLVVGGVGLVGRATVERFTGREDLLVVGLCRRSPDFSQDATWVSADLRDREASIRALAPHRDATHLIYAALHEQPNLVEGWRSLENISINRDMLCNTFLALEGAPLQHVTLLQGTKAYGVHTRRPMRVPAREEDAVRDHANFYFDQHDLVAELSHKVGFRYTIMRPQIVFGHAAGSAMNVVAALGVYSTVMREIGRPLSYLGHPGLLMEGTDARLIASAVEWSWNEPKAHSETFNITNGDVILWRSLFERLGAYFKMPLGEPSQLRPSEEMPKYAATWRKISEREGLRLDDMDALVGLSWQYSEATWASLHPLPVPPLLSTIKLRQFGFSECIDSEESILQHLDEMRAQRYLPKH